MGWAVDTFFQDLWQAKSRAHPVKVRSTLVLDLELS